MASKASPRRRTSPSSKPSRWPGTRSGKTTSRMRLLLVAATDQEIAPLVARLTPVSHSLERWASFGYGPLAALGHGSHDVDILVTGVGMTATATWCARAGPGNPM